MDGKHYPILVTCTSSLDYYIPIVYPSGHCVCIHSQCVNGIAAKTLFNINLSITCNRDHAEI